MGLLVLPWCQWCQFLFFFSHAEKNAFVAVERCWSNTLKMIKTIELLPLPFFFFFFFWWGGVCAYFLSLPVVYRSDPICLVVLVN